MGGSELRLSVVSASLEVLVGSCTLVEMEWLVVVRAASLFNLSEDWNCEK